MADAFPNGKRRRCAEVTNRSVPRQDHIIETDRSFANGLESSAATVSEEDRMPTVQNLSEVQRKCGVKGCNDPSIGSYNLYQLSPNGIPSGNQRWYGLVYLEYTLLVNLG